MKTVLDENIMPLLEGMDLEDIPDLGQQDIKTMTDAILLDELPQRTALGFNNVPFSNGVSVGSVGESQIDNVSLAKADDQLIIKISGTVEIEVEGFIDNSSCITIRRKPSFTSSILIGTIMSQPLQPRWQQTSNSASSIR